MGRLFKLGFIALVVGAIAVALYMRSYLASPLAGISEPVVYLLPGGASLSGVARELAEEGLLESPRLFVAWGRFTGQAAALKAGEYELQPGTTPKSLLDQFVAGQVKLYPITILEGWTIRDVLATLAANQAIEHTLDGMTDAERRAAAGIEAGHLEGQFYPETYLVPRGTRDAEVLQQAARLMQAELAAAWDARAVGLPLQSPYELLTLASIVERETRLDSERPQVAGVFIRRLQKNMRLETDPTVIYGLGDSYDGNITRKDLKTDTPYNTYTRRGLPPTPIGMPSRASLLAAGQPDDGDALYFVATGEPDGSHVFSSNYEDHKIAVAAYISRLKQQRLEGN